MSFQWPDPFSFVADVMTYLGFPTLVVSTYLLYREVKKQREEARRERDEAKKARGVSEGRISFNDVDQKCAINSVPFKQLALIPRVGDHVYLPGETEEHKNFGGGKYEVVGVDFHYCEDSEAHPFIPAKPSVIEIMVRKIASFS